METHWLFKIDNCKTFGPSIFQGRQRYTEVTIINMYLLIEIKHNIIIQYHEVYIEVEKLQLYVCNWHFKKLLPKQFGFLEGLGIQKTMMSRGVWIISSPSMTTSALAGIPKLGCQNDNNRWYLSTTCWDNAGYHLTLMLLVAYLANTNVCQKPEKWLNP